ncbi:MAG: hypothetical protein AAB896_01975 [Patescibacteria group bacterium]
MDLADFNPTHFKPTHRAKLWMAVTIVVVLLGASSVYYFTKKTYDVKQNEKPTTAQKDTTPLPAQPAEQAKQVSEELKSVNLAELQAAVKDIKEILAAF